MSLKRAQPYIFADAHNSGESLNFSQVRSDCAYNALEGLGEGQRDVWNANVEGAAVFDATRSSLSFITRANLGKR